jgi:hypothetical protein
MKLIPEQKGKAALYLIVILAALGGAAYMMYGRGEPARSVDENQAAIEAQAAKINSTVQSPPPAPDLPVDKRPPRGAPTTVK